MAFGEPLAFSVLTRAGVSAADVEAAERAGLLSTEEAGSDIRVRLGHPLFGEVIRAQTPQMRRRTVHTTLAEAVGSADGLRSEDAVRIAVWHLEAGTLPDPELLVAAAGWALAALDYQLAEQLCRAAGEAGTNWPAERLLAQALVGQGKAGPAEDLLAGQFARARTDAERAEIVSVRALNLYWGLNQPEQARAVLDEAAARIAESAQRAGLDAMRGRFLLHDGRCPQALAVLGPVLADPGCAAPGHAGGDGYGHHGAVACGRYDDAIAHGGTGACGWPGRRLARAGCWRWTSWPPPRPSPICGAGSSQRRPRWPNPATSEPWMARSPPNVALWALVRGQLAAARGAMSRGLGMAQGGHRDSGRTGPAAPLPGFHRPGRT